MMRGRRVQVITVEEVSMSFQFTVMFTQRPVPPDFPGETGTLGFLRICPPIDQGDFRLVPQIQVAHWRYVLSDVVGPTIAYVPFEGVPGDLIPVDLDGSKMIGSALVWRHQGSKETALEVLRDSEGRVVMAVFFVGSVLHFRLRTLEVALDCTWAAGVEGFALARWEPGRIVLTHIAPNAEGTCAIRSVTSDVHAVDSTMLLGMPGDNLDAMLQHVRGDQPPPTLSFGIAVCLLSSHPLSSQVTQDIGRRYGEALRELLTLDGVVGSQIVGIPIHLRSQVVDGELFERWRQVLGYPLGWGGEAWSVLVSSESPREAIEEIQDLQAYASLTSMMRIAGVEDELIPPTRMAGRDPSEVLWHHVARRRILDDDQSWQLRDRLQAQVWEVGRRLVLQCEHLHELYEQLGEAWLEEQASKARQRLAGKRVNANMMVDLHPAVLGWLWLREDVILDEASHHDEKVRAWAWLTQLATDLKSVGSRIAPDVRRRLLNDLRTDAYRQAAFEVKVAALLQDGGAEPAFVPPGDKRSPDLRVEREGLHYFVECCQKAPDSEEIERALKLANELAGLKLGQEARSRRSTCTTLSFKTLLTPDLFAETRTLLDEVGGAGERETDHVSVVSTPLGDWSAIYNSNDLVRDVGARWDRVYVGAGRMPFWPMTRIMNASLVAVDMHRERDLLKSLESTLDDKGAWQSKKGQIPDDGLGVLALGLGDCSRATVLKLAPQLKDRLERSHEAVSVILLIWDEREHENMLTCLVKTYCVPIVNSRAAKQWPPSSPLPVGDVRTVGFTSQPGAALRGRDAGRSTAGSRLVPHGRR
jgi:hypothetical protein